MQFISEKKKYEIGYSFGKWIKNIRWIFTLAKWLLYFSIGISIVSAFASYLGSLSVPTLLTILIFMVMFR